MNNILAVLGFIVAVVGPVAAALASNPLVAAHAKLVSILAAAGVFIMACGVALKALTGNAYIQAPDIYFYFFKITQRAPLAYLFIAGRVRGR